MPFSKTISADYTKEAIQERVERASILQQSLENRLGTRRNEKRKRSGDSVATVEMLYRLW